MCEDCPLETVPALALSVSHKLRRFNDVQHSANDLGADSANEFAGYLNFDYASANCSFAWNSWIKAQYCWARYPRELPNSQADSLAVGLRTNLLEPQGPHILVAIT